MDEEGALPQLLNSSPRELKSKENVRVQSSKVNCGLVSRAGHMVSQDNVENKLPDHGSEIASRYARFVIFFAFCQGVQAFMSYDGGATPASLDTIQEEMNGAWEPAEFGILGSMDKIGMTVTSILWGRCLQLCGAKPLLIGGLLVNAACTFGFGSLRTKWLMLVAKFLMGATQSLQGVWATVWTVTMAPPERKTMWLGLGAVSAGIGNGIGTAVAGFGTANGLPYSFAFQLQAGVLFLLWIGLLVVPAKKLAMRLSTPTKDVAIDSSPSFSATHSGLPLHASDDTSKTMGVRAQIAELWRNKLFCYTTLQISLIMFETSGIQYIWVRVFVHLWGLSKSFVTLMYLIVAGVGGAIGVALGPAYIDKKGGYGTMPGIVRTLSLLQSVAVVAAISGALAIACLYFKLKADASGPWGDGWLYSTWLFIGAIHALHNGSVAALSGINIESVSCQMQTFASGAELTVRNILGYAFGPLLPALVMQLVETWEGWGRLTDPDNEKWQLFSAIAFILAMNVFGILVLKKGKESASRELHESQRRALDGLREGFIAQDIAALERAVVQARAVELQKTDGEAVMGMANQLIGAYRANTAGIQDVFHHSTIFSATPVQLQQRVLELEREVSRLKEALKEDSGSAQIPTEEKVNMSGLSVSTDPHDGPFTVDV